MTEPSPARDDRPFLVLTGPTAVGKTDLSLELAGRMGAEILSADSRQIYRQLTIGTAKPSPSAREAVPHHFVDELDLETPFSAGAFAEAAYRRIGEILARGSIPLVVGGSTLYLHALQYGIADIPAVDPDVRADVERRLRREGAEQLYAELARVDPTAAATMDATKSQRLVRALEVYHGTGRPISSFHEAQAPPPYAFRTIVLYREREELYARINQRVDQMLEAGLLDEVREILELGHDPSLQALQTIGYREPISYLRGEIPYREMVRLLKRNTRRYAKRQLTWFRREEAYTWIERPASAGAILELQ